MYSKYCVFAFSPLFIAGCLDDAAQAPPETKIECAVQEVIGTDRAIQGGDYLIGDTRFYPEEGPQRRVKVAPFAIDATEVTNGQFREFVLETGYVTRAERGLSGQRFNHFPDELREPGSAVFIAPLSGEGANPMSWWRFVKGASWSSPEGPGSSIDGKENYPVVHVAFEDALAYAEWKGRRLPTEAEWEAAARGGLVGARYAWGDDGPDAQRPSAANTWQGVFPYINQESDGYAGVAPVGCYAANAYGIYDLIGNVWEWTADPFFASREEIHKTPMLSNVDQLERPGVQDGVIKGGSYLCADNYCARFRPAARQPQELTLGASHIGFRTVRDAARLEESFEN